MADKVGDKIRVVITDDHAILREGLASLMEKQPDIVVVAEAEDGRECLEKAAALLPDVVVMDIKIPGISGIEACRRLKTSQPLVKVIMLSMYDDYVYIDQALKVGADGYLLKKVAGSELVEAVRKVARSEKAFSPQILDIIVESFKDGTTATQGSSPLDSITHREHDMLVLLSEGLSNKEIASRLSLSPKTVEKVMTGIYRKLGVKSRTAAVKLFLSHRDVW